MEILYGGAFNPPTIAHKQIVLYLLNKFDAHITILPSNDRYKEDSVIDFNHRYNMLKIMFKDIDVIISDFELKQNEKYLGTCDTLEKLNHPYFVIGADQLDKIDTWINHEKLVKENNFIVFPRDGYNILNRLNKEDLIDYKDHFVVIDDFKEINVSSTEFRELKNKSVVSEEVYKYIVDNKLYN